MRTVSSRLLIASAVLVVATLAGCPKGKIPGGSNIPGGGNVPGALGGESGMVDPNTCGNYAASDAGRKLKAFLQATQDLQTTTENTVKVVRESCIILGKELGMIEADLNGETKDVCAKVYGQVDANMKVAFKAK